MRSGMLAERPTLPGAPPGFRNRRYRIMKPLSLVTGLAVLAGVLVWGVAPGTGDDKKEEPPKRSIDRKDPAFDKLIPKEATLETLSGGYAWTEGPVWVNKDGGYLLFSDIPNNRVMKWQEGKEAAVFLKPSGYDGKET